jgi:hypothetical protein
MGTPARWTEWLRGVDGPLWAVLDAARDDRVLALLYSTGAEHCSLYEGSQGTALADVAPYLVRVDPGSPLLAQLAPGWGRAWGVWLTSHASAKVIRSRLRRLLMVHVGDSPRPMYFRFYDPRVLRVMLPSATPRQVSWFFGDGEIGSYVVESRDGHAATVLTDAGRGMLRVEQVVLAEGGEDHAFAR